MQALTFDPSTDDFTVSDLPVPKVGEKDVLVKVEACGLNPVDAKIVQWKFAGMKSTWVPGLDVSGRIVEVGPAVGDWQVGDQVLCHGNMFRPNGGFAEFTIQDSETLIPHPKLPAEVAASLPCAGWTAWRALNDKLRASQHNSVLIAGGSGGVGGFALQIASHFGMETIITTCSSANRDYVLELGATHAIDYKHEDIVDRVREITDGQGVAIGLDTVGPDNDVLVANSLKFEGQMVELVDVVRPGHYEEAFMRGLSFHQLSLGAGHRHGPASKHTLVTAGKAFSELAERGVIQVPVLKQISLDEVGTTLKDLLKRRTVGKIVLSF